MDDSRTRRAGRCARSSYRRAGLDISYVHRDDRAGFKAGALENGLRTAKGELVAIFDADFVPRADALRKLVHFFSDPLVACAQMRWSHINGSYNLLTRLQTILLDGHFVVEQTVRSARAASSTSTARPDLETKSNRVRAVAARHAPRTQTSPPRAAHGLALRLPLDEDAPSEVPVEINAFKAQQRRWAKGVTEVALKLYPRIWGRLRCASSGRCSSV